jgi:hypothetical protein
LNSLAVTVGRRSTSCGSAGYAGRTRPPLIGVRSGPRSHRRTSCGSVPAMNLDGADARHLVGASGREETPLRPLDGDAFTQRWTSTPVRGSRRRLGCAPFARAAVRLKWMTHDHRTEFRPRREETFLAHAQVAAWSVGRAEHERAGGPVYVSGRMAAWHAECGLRASGPRAVFGFGPFRGWRAE